MSITIKKYDSGFTLIEMMVAVSIFSIVALISTSSILAIVDANRKAQSLKSVVNNLHFTMETISRNIRVGRTYSCRNSIPGGTSIRVANDCLSGGSVLALEPQFGDPADDADQLIYIYKEAEEGIFRQRGNDGSTEPLLLTAPEVHIQYMRFYVDGAQLNNDGVQPRVRIIAKGFAEIGRARSEFSLQTTVTQRIFDL